MRSPWLISALVAGLTSSALAAPTNPATKSPVAVMPFQNLQRAGDLEWLEAGIAETMISDLKKSGAVEIVERGQIDRAMAEIALQGVADLYNPSDAARVGRIVGAKTIVVGAFQRAGKRLRITARFVEVETGVVKGSAKATGALTKVFSLQDQIVDQLVYGKPGKKRAKLPARPKRKQTKRALEAYRVYALSLAAPDAKRLGLLREAVKLDPELRYATRDLDALEKRLRGLDRAAGAAQQQVGAATLARVLDKAAPADERAALARVHLEGLESNRRFAALAKDAPKIAAAGLAASPEWDPAEGAAWGLVLAKARLRELDLALQAGEAYLKLFPAGPRYRAVEALVREIVDERRALASQREDYREDLNDVEADAAELRGRGVKRTDPAWEDVDWGACIAAKWARLPAEIERACREYLERWEARADLDEDVGERVPDAAAWVAWAYARQGKFAEAWKRAEALRAKHPRALQESQMGDGQKVHSIEGYWMKTWPTDAKGG